MQPYLKISYLVMFQGVYPVTIVVSRAALAAPLYLHKGSEVVCFPLHSSSVQTAWALPDALPSGVRTFLNDNNLYCDCQVRFQLQPHYRSSKYQGRLAGTKARGIRYSNFSCIEPWGRQGNLDTDNREAYISDANLVAGCDAPQLWPFTAGYLRNHSANRLLTRNVMTVQVMKQNCLCQSIHIRRNTMLG